METVTPLVCGISTSEGPCDQPAIGKLAVQVHPPALGGERQPAALLVCVRHLAYVNEQAEAVFPPGAGTKGS